VGSSPPSGTTPIIPMEAGALHGARSDILCRDYSVFLPNMNTSSLTEGTLARSTARAPTYCAAITVSCFQTGILRRKQRAFWRPHHEALRADFSNGLFPCHQLQMQQCSGEPKEPALPRPVEGNVRSSEKTSTRQSWRLSAFDNRADDVGGEERDAK